MNDQYANGAGLTQPQGATTSKVICIAAKADGTFMVYPDNDGAGEHVEDGEDVGGQSAPDVDSALKLAKQMLGGQDSAPDDAEALFQGGFQGARGQLNKG